MLAPRTRLPVTETSMLYPIAFAMRKMQTSMFNKVIVIKSAIDSLPPPCWRSSPNSAPHSRTRLSVTETSMLYPVAFAMCKMQTSIFNKKLSAVDS
jgi:hypothetical protein